jgi:transcriptional antiterminator NusG
MEQTVSSTEKKWFVLRAISGKENKVKLLLESEIEFAGWENIICQVLIPTEKVYKIKKGKKITQEKSYFPGYMLLEINEKLLNKDIVQTINQMTNVIAFLSDKEKKPIPIRPAEVNRILGRVDEMQDADESMSEPFIVGETIKIVDGPFNDFNGVIEEVYDEKKKLKVMVKIFGRRTPVELNFMQVEKH